MSAQEAAAVVQASSTAAVIVARCRRHPTYVLASCDTCRASYVHLPTPRRTEQ